VCGVDDDDHGLMDGWMGMLLGSGCLDLGYDDDDDDMIVQSHVSHVHVHVSLVFCESTIYPFRKLILFILFFLKKLKLLSSQLFFSVTQSQ